jgi:hypothetical protein
MQYPGMTKLNAGTLILELRADLRLGLAFDQPDRLAAFTAWCVTSGALEYGLLTEDEAFRQHLALASTCDGITSLQHWVLRGRPDVVAAFALPQQLQQFLQWFYTHGVNEHKLWQWLTPVERVHALGQPSPWADRAAVQAADYAQTLVPTPSVQQRPWGVNLVGYAFGQLGIGEDARMAAQALLAAGVPMTMLNFPPGADIGQNDTSMADHVTRDGPFALNLFCLTALENGRFYAERGRKQFAGRYNIGYWPWELSQWPAQWEALVNLVDEVWVSTQHTLDALAPVVAAMAHPVPVRLMPMAVELGPVAHAGLSRLAVRQQFALPKRARLFCYSFDLNSSIHRKNPQAAVDAFLMAFTATEWGPEQVGLVIKVHRPAKRNSAWERLKALAAKDARIHIVEETMPRPELLALYQACDCFVSLHRAEGFGRGIAEALQLGLHVITTGYSGNVDFCQLPQFAQQVDLVRFRMVKVKEGQYPYGQGQVWANADVGHAASLMRAFVDRFGSGKRSGPIHSVPKAGWPVFSAAQVGRRYRERLAQVWGEFGGKLLLKE